MTEKEIAGFIDHTQLSACATEDDIKKLCAEAVKYGFASCCVNPYYVPMAAEILRGTGVKVCTVIGFPLGANSIDDKASQAAMCVSEGADEVDMVVNLGAVKDGKWDEVLEEIYAVRCAVDDVDCGESKKIVEKVILETCYLNDEEIVAVCRKALEAGADFVKTSTGFGTGGATVHAVELMRKTVGKNMGVKASGGIHSFEEAVAMIEAGADRLGCSASVKIVEG
ncbi:deoxyribose-phosphate aldolase [uncultured Treponema sp.]|uniref:deoxyribose-phosphate aldolase n=1 Tax=uncultured Treponema sp. TaxID=162155 RepID=UPI0015BF978F|nr:deoxyribose-phosphate aldolase [uncultured Treponema sp.]